MQVFRRTQFLFLLGLATLIITTSCEEEMTTIGAEVIGGEPFVTGKAVYDVFAFNRKIEAVQTNKLPVYQLGVYQDSVYGRTEAQITSQLSLLGGQGNPVFGVYSQNVEDGAEGDDDSATINENERIKSVFFYLPYLQNPSGDRDTDGVTDELDVDPGDPNSDSDGDTISDSQETLSGTNPLDPDTDGDGIRDDEDEETVVSQFPRRVDLDSIYGNRNQDFTLKIARSTFFLRDQDPATNFEQAQEYYSTQQFSPTFIDEVLFEGPLQISDEEILLFAEDDPDTEEDESEDIPERLQPGIRVPLDNAFWQQNFLDMEGKSELLSRANFNEFMRGIHLSLVPSQPELLFLFDLTRASITITYEFDRIEEGSPTVEERTYTMNLITGGGNVPISGNAVNTFINDPYPASVDGALDTGENASRIYLKGGAGAFSEIHLFEENNGSTIIEQIRTNNWIINEANLVFYVDQNAMTDVQLSEQPVRLYLYNAETNAPIYNAVNETNVADSPFGFFLDYDGFIETENDQGLKYTFRITEHVNNLVVRDSVNAILGLTSTPDIRITGSNNSRLTGGIDQDLPVSTNITPLGTVLFGSNLPGTEEDVKLKLEISFTETN